MPLLPLFPLDVVLLPGVPMPLHIFEPRYKEMIGECIEQKKPFGVVRSKESEGLAEFGCTAEIIQLIKRYDDGRMDIMTVGRQRFEIEELNQDRSFLQANVTFLDEEEEDAENAEAEEPSDITADRKRALELFEEVAELIGTEQEVDPDAALLSYQLAGALPMDLDFKQALLGVRSESERLAGLIEFLESIMPKLKKAARRREKAGGNGHVP